MYQYRHVTQFYCIVPHSIHIELYSVDQCITVSTNQSCVYNSVDQSEPVAEPWREAQGSLDVEMLRAQEVRNQLAAANKLVSDMTADQSDKAAELEVRRCRLTSG